jgi:methyl-accepting chemotaxis protein
MLKNLTIKHKFTGMLLGLLITLVLISVIVYASLLPVQTGWHQYHDRITAREELLADIQAALGLGGLLQHYQEYRATGDRSAREAVESDLDRLEADIAAYREFPVLADGEVRALDRIAGFATDYRGHLDEAERTATATLGAGVLQALGSLQREYERRAERAEAAITAGFSDTLFNLLAISLLALLTGGLVFTLVSRSITGPMREMQNLMNHIEAENDLTLRFEYDRNDEIGSTVRATNRMLDKFATITRQVHGSGERLLTEIERVSQTSDETERSMEQQRSEVDRVAGAMKEMSGTVQEVARNAESAAQSARTAHEDAAEGKRVVNETVTAINRLAGQVNEASEVIQKLAADSENIGSVLDVIREIADQTNLLALNAAIEAARAGEAGRGFAVVADEVRSLASRTQQSTQEIQQMIENLQTAASQAVEVMGRSREDAEETVGHASHAGESLESIDHSVEAISEMNQQIASAAEEQAAVTDEMNQNLVSISDMAAQTTEGADQTARTSEQAVRQVEGLRAMVDQFRIEQSGALDLASFKAGHLAWAPHLRHFLDGDRRIPDHQAMSEHDCALGRWYNEEGRARWGHLDAASGFEELHARLHTAVNSVIQQGNAGDPAAAEAAYEKVEPLARELAERLDHMEMEAGTGTAR